jgi:hypothetical protein
MAVSDERRAVAASAADAYKKMLAENPDIAAQLDGFRAAFGRLMFRPPNQHAYAP